MTSHLNKMGVVANNISLISKKYCKSFIHLFKSLDHKSELRTSFKDYNYKQILFQGPRFLQRRSCR
jgi:hypothetical protein